MTSTVAEATDTQCNPGGAPVGNRNAMRHGLRTARLPQGCERIGRDLNRVRMSLEDAVVACKGNVQVNDALRINAAIEWERHRRLAGRWLNQNFDAMSHDSRLAYSRDAAKAATERNKVTESLGLDQSADHLWASIYGGPQSELQVKQITEGGESR